MPETARDLPDADELDQLVAAAQGGDHQAFEDLVLQLEADLRLFLLMHGAQASEAEELLQECFVAAYRSLSDYRGPGTFRAWIKAIARHRLIDWIRQQQRRRDRAGDPVEGVVLDVQLERLAGCETSHDYSVRLAACLDRLSQRARQLIERRHLENHGLSDLARAFKIPKQQVAYHLTRIRRQLARCLEQP